MSSKGPKRKRYDSAGPGLQLDPAAKEQVHKLFEKKFTFHKPEDEKWMIRNLENQAEDQDSSKFSENLSALKAKLNKLKDRLSDKDIIKWHTHTKFQHTSGGVMVELKTSYQIELCTQAWCKFYEILSQFPIVPEEILKGFTSVHLCEAPGAFISALNHFLCCKGFKAKWKWLATTLSPYYEGNSHGQMIDDDRFIRETVDKWYFGEDGSGNLMDTVNIDGLVTKASEHGDVNLVTADGSIDCQDSPSEQELLVSELHYYETLAALKLLCKGGCFVLKVFTMFEEASITLMYILNCCFNQVDVIKPCTSKPGNSELYVVCQDFIGQGQDETIYALQYISNYNNGLIKNQMMPSYPKSFLTQHAECCQQFVTYQIEAIQSNLDTYEKMDSEQENWQISKREYCQERFVSKFKIRQIPQYSKIVNTYFKKYSSFKLEKSFELVLRSPVKSTSPHSYKCSKNSKLTGSFHERQQQCSLPWNAKLQQMEMFEYSLESLKLQCQQPLSSDEVQDWTTETGRIINSVESSKFCDSKVLGCWNELNRHKTETNDKKKYSIRELAEELINHVTSNSDETSSDVPTVYCYNCDNNLTDELNDITKIRTKVITTSTELSDLDRGTLFCQIVKPVISETSCDVKKLFLSTVHDICKNLKSGCSVILQLSTCLTRFTAGLIFVLSRCFMKTSTKIIPSVSHLHQLIYLQVFTGGLDELTTYLQTAMIQLDDLDHRESPLTVVEIVPLIKILSDNQFMRFINQANRNILIEYINTTIQSEKNILRQEKQIPVTVETNS